MKLELFTLSDFAEDFQGKLVIVGTFDMIKSQKFPAIHPQCTIVFKIRFNKEDKLSNNFKIDIVNSNSQKTIFNIDGNMQSTNLDNLDTFTSNVIININGLHFDNEGVYNVNLSINNKIEGKLPLYLIKI